MLLGPGDLLDRHYVIERCLAVGGAGLTYLARETDPEGAATGPRLAIKVLYSARAAGPFLRRLSNEAQILQELAHDHIVQLRGFVHRAGHEPYLVTLFEEGGSLSDHVKRVGPLDPGAAAAILKQILLALDVAHQSGVVHRDLKPDNVLLSSSVPADAIPHCRVADFGIAKVSGHVGTQLTSMGAFVGTPEYAAPEQFEGGSPGPPTDVFAAAGVLIFLLTGHPPFRFAHRADPSVCHREMLSQLPITLDDEQVRGTPEQLAQLQAVVHHLMATRPEQRWTIQQTLHALQPLLGAPRAKPLGTLDADEITVTKPPRGAPTPVHPSVADDPPAPPPSIVSSLVATSAPPSMASLNRPPPSMDAPHRAPTGAAHANTPAEPPEPVFQPIERAASPSPLESISDAPPPPFLRRRGATAPTMPPMPDGPPGTFTPPPAPPPFHPPTAPADSSTPSLDVPSPSSSVAPMGRRQTRPDGPRSSGSRALGCVRASLVGIVVVALAGSAAATLVLAVAAWSLGWFGGSIVTEPVVVEDTLEQRYREAPDLPADQRSSLFAAVQARAPSLREKCGSGAEVRADVLVDPRGKIVYAKVAAEGLGPVAGDCVQRGLERTTAAGIRQEGRAKVSFRF
ncbi:MAG: protein kinase [Myxococcales bacterium]|nr:protein kinase [Myxococcales bacterium]